MKIKFSEFPHFWKALHCVYVDNVPAQIREEGREEYECNCTTLQAELAELHLQPLTDQEMWDFCTGDDKRQLEIIDKYGLNAESDFLDDFFEAGCNVKNPKLLYRYGIKG